MSDIPAKNTANTNGSSEALTELPVLEKPEQPAPNECCESGCTPCVWDVYYEAMRNWQEQQATRKP